MGPIEENQYISPNVGQLKLSQAEAVMIASIRNGLEKSGELTGWKTQTQAYPIRYILTQIEQALTNLSR